MKLEILSTYSEHGEIFKYKLYDGPDAHIESQGECTSLGEVFERVIMHQVIHSMDYYDFHLVKHPK